MKKAKSARPKLSSPDTTTIPSAPSGSVDQSSDDSQSASHHADCSESSHSAVKQPPARPQGAQSRPQARQDDYQDIPEDALPPARPDPILSLQLSAALHSKLRYQAQDEGISVEALALEMPSSWA